jgi:hypothetical protein
MAFFDDTGLVQSGRFLGRESPVCAQVDLQLLCQAGAVL